MSYEAVVLAESAFYVPLDLKVFFSLRQDCADEQGYCHHCWGIACGAK